MGRLRVPLIALVALGLLGVWASSGLSDPAPATTRAASWRPLHPALLRRTEVGAARIGGFIYVVGGLAPGTTAAVERYDIRRNRWSRARSMPVAVNHPAVAALHGRLYVFGGYTDSSQESVIGTLQEFDPKTARWRRLPASHTPRAAAALVATGGRLYAVGGAAEGQPLATLEAYDPARRRWSSDLPPMGVAREHIAAAAVDGRIYVFGGRVNQRNLDVAERYDPLRRRWSRLPPLRFARSGFAAARVGAKIIAFGGEELDSGRMTIKPVELFDPERSRWRRLPGMLTPRHGLGGASLGRSVFAIEGGPGPGDCCSDRMEVIRLPRRLLRQREP